jgi:hypothetical protein
MNEQVIADLLHSKRWSFAQIITLAEHQVVIGWVENSTCPLIVTVMGENEEVDVHTLWDKVVGLKDRFETNQAIKDLIPDPSSSAAKTYLAIVASDSTISYYFVDKRSLSLDELPQKA